MKKVTIGICIRHYKKAVMDAFKSVLLQNFPHDQMEIIVVCAANKNEFLSIIKGYLPKFDIDIKFISDKGKGLGFARQLVVDHAQGEYIAWIDDDIIIKYDYIKKQTEFLDKNPGVAAVQGFKGIYENSNLVGLLENMSKIPFNLKKEIKFLSTGGSLYRVKSIKNAGGFDKKIKGSSEDIDLSYRMWKKGWKLCRNGEKWAHLPRETWKSLWEEYYWYGYGAHFLAHKHRRLINLWQWLPLVAFIIGFKFSILIYKQTYRKVSFLLPLHSFYKNSAWLIGYVKAHLENYGHPNKL
ncbi:MAG: glycosyltransferase [Candidatus Bathyarchaeia archaeon]